MTNPYQSPRAVQEDDDSTEHQHANRSPVSPHQFAIKLGITLLLVLPLATLLLVTIGLFLISLP